MTQPWLAGYLPTMVRVFLGVLLLSHGIDKFTKPGGLDALIQEIADHGWPMPQLQGFIAVFVEFAGGVLLLAGFLTRPAAFAVAVQFGIIVFVWAAAGPFFKSQEKALMYSVMAAYIFLAGPGRISVDHRLFADSALERGPTST
jgi:putative oxidoreductase